jgi:hypothetical protein
MLIKKELLVPYDIVNGSFFLDAKHLVGDDLFKMPRKFDVDFGGEWGIVEFKFDTFTKDDGEGDPRWEYESDDGEDTVYVYLKLPEGC